MAKRFLLTNFNMFMTYLHLGSSYFLETAISTVCDLNADTSGTGIFSFLWTVRMYASVVCATCASCCSSLYNKRHPTGQHAVHQSKRPHCTTRCDVRGPHPAHADLFVTRCPSRDELLGPIQPAR